MSRSYSFLAEESGVRLDSLLSSLLEDLSRSYIQKLLEGGQVLLNGVPAPAKNTRVKAGDKIELELPEAEVLSVAAEEIPLRIVYEDESLLVVDKPRGMVVHPAPGNESGTLVNALLWHCGESLSGINGVQRPGIVHRIDKDTGGLLVVAKTDAAHRGLAAQLEAHSMTRVYEALVYNNITEDEGTVDAPLGRDPQNRLRRRVIAGGKRAVTHYKVLERFGRSCRIEARLETGRTHQIRVHMAYIKHPLIGDALYGPKKGMSGVEGQMLHAKVLGFVHPLSGAYLEFESPLPEAYLSVLERLRAGR